MNLAIVLLAAVLVTVLSEYMLWSMFRRKAEPLVFPKELDTSAVGFFTIGRMRVFTLIHTALMIVVLCAVFSFLW
jgi:hypothetical protein